MLLTAHGPLRRTSMLPRTRTLTAAAILAAAFYVPVHILADQDEGQGKVAGGNANGNRRTNNLYVVQMAEVPVVSYAGGTNGLPATKPGRRQKIDPLNAAVVQYAAYLDARHDQSLAAVGGSRKVYDYHYTFNGFAAELTEAQAAALSGDARVLKVTKDDLQFADTSSAPTFLGLEAPGGFWG